MTPSTLHLCGGQHGYRLAFLTPDRFEVVGEYRTWEEAVAAKRAAEHLTQWLTPSASAAEAWGRASGRAA